ncbi:DUF6941 family protein [Caballeronia grimmiae]|uniref:DUF6941 family protein n=1 Tax=Caballeronia grimmiae TaxID=1071679 RepID=UPI0038BBBAB0
MMSIPAITKANRFVSAIYCDDVRVEVSNKLSFIGIYRQTLIVPSLPAKLLKLCVVVEVVCPSEQRYQSAEVGVYKDEDLIGFMRLQTDESMWRSIPAEGGFLATSVPFVFENAPVENPGHLRIRVTFDDGQILPAPSLSIGVDPQYAHGSSD